MPLLKNINILLESPHKSIHPRIKLCQNLILEGVQCENSGWGNTDQNGVTNPDELQVVTIPIIGQKECIELWGDHSNIGDDNLCAGGKDKGPCNVRHRLKLIKTLLIVWV